MQVLLFGLFRLMLRFFYLVIGKVLPALHAEVFSELRAGNGARAEPPVPAKEHLHLLTAAVTKCLHENHPPGLFVHNIMFRGETQTRFHATEILSFVNNFQGPAPPIFRLSR